VDEDLDLLTPCGWLGDDLLIDLIIGDGPDRALNDL
jgi:hypothetical protein